MAEETSALAHLKQRLDQLAWQTARKIIRAPTSRVSQDISKKAFELIGKADFSGACSLLEREEHVDNDPIALDYLALALLGEEQFEEAVRVGQHAIDLFRQDLAIGLANHCVVLERLARHLKENERLTYADEILDKAAIIAEESVRQCPSLPAAHINRLMVACTQQNINSVLSIIVDMKQRWPAWHQSSELKERLTFDSTLQLIRELPDLRSHFPNWIQ